MSANDKICRNFVIEDILSTIDVPSEEMYSENEIIKGHEILVCFLFITDYLLKFFFKI